MRTEFAFLDLDARGRAAAIVTAFAFGYLAYAISLLPVLFFAEWFELTGRASQSPLLLAVVVTTIVFFLVGRFAGKFSIGKSVFMAIGCLLYMVGAHLFNQGQGNMMPLVLVLVGTLVLTEPCACVVRDEVKKRADKPPAA